MEPNYTVRLCIYSELHSAEEISGLIGMQFDKKWEKGTPRHKFSDKCVFQTNAWIIESGVSREEPFPIHIETIMNRIKAIKSRFKTLSEDCQTFINCSYRGEYAPEIYLSNELINEIAAINASIDIDTHCEWIQSVNPVS